jgi:hypothetical protein
MFMFMGGVVLGLGTGNVHDSYVGMYSALPFGDSIHLFVSIEAHAKQ